MINNPHPFSQKKLEEFIEKGAAIEHERWAGWQKYLHSKCTKNDDGSLTIPAYSVERWKRQIATPYSELSEQEKESDRHEVRKYLPLLLHTIEDARIQGRKERDGELKTVKNLLQRALCPDSPYGCDNKGTFADRTEDGGWVPAPCEWCHKRDEILALLEESKEGVEDEGNKDIV